MNSHAYKKTAIAASLLLTLTGLFSTMACADPACDPDETRASNTSESTPTQVSSDEFVEPTDAQLTELPDKINRIFDKLETAGDVKYYSFTALRGQKVMVNHVQQGDERSHWKVEYNIGDKWQPAPTFDSLITPSLTVGQKVKLRISHQKGLSFKPNNFFHIDFGSAPYAHNIRIETRGPRTGTYFSTTTFRDQIEWATNIRDSTDEYLEGATVDFILQPDNQNPSTTIRSQRVTIGGGGIVQYIDFPSCVGRHSTAPFTGVYDNIRKWRAGYNTGHWYVTVRGNPNTGISPVPITQICTIGIIG
ncbi:hypothetical protein NPS29_19010 [Pseudomonas putida]|uniref:hypothetical protein n=1 Tax=Pseudomonas putida TaxID=303 RepID=UPI0023643101|nr:hypothetical protein [Pseudomonas putida]MDD1967423.1 hypothetical protein [Pseudomonas putida]